MGKVYLKENYDTVLEALCEKSFYIFGNTQYAHIFYLYCKEMEIDGKIKGFILSDIHNLEAHRKLPVLHGMSVRDINWLKENDKRCNMFLAAKEKTIQEQLIPRLEGQLEGNWYYVSEFVNSIMYYRYMYTSYRDIITQYDITVNLSEGGILTVTNKETGNFYSYGSKVAQGVLPDLRIFNNEVEIDNIHSRQLGKYVNVNNNCQKEKSEKVCRVYLTRSHFDSELKEDMESSFTKEIQVGSSLTDADISELKDNIGENLSKRNRDYCEMSAVYWAWRNDKDSDYIGLCHYRRRFAIDADNVNYIMSENYDAVYIIPHLIDGGLREEFVERNYFLTPEMWELTEKAIERISPDYLDAWEKLDVSFFLLPCNMFIMRRGIFEDYCSWVFAILEEVDRYYLEQGIQRNDRYLGYIAELLNTVYAMKNKDTLKKGYVYMKILESE